MLLVLAFIIVLSVINVFNGKVVFIITVLFCLCVFFWGLYLCGTE